MPIAAPAGRRRPICSSARRDRRRARLGHRPGRAPPPELHPARTPSPTRRRSRCIRHRRLRGDARRGAASSPTSPASPARAAEREAKGKLRGLGFACYIEACGIAPSAVVGALGARRGLFESAKVRVHPTGRCTVFTGSHSHGQGHETTFAQVVADEARHADRERRGRPRRHRQDARSAWAPTARARSRSAARRSSRRSTRSSPRARRSPRTCSRRPRPTSSSRTAASRSPAPTEPSRIGEVALDGLRAAQLPARQARAGLEETAFYDPTNFTYPGRRLHLRGRGRPRHRRGRDRPLRRGRRLRQRHQPDDRRGPGARRPRPGHRPGADRGLRLRRERPAADRLLHGLLHAAGGRPAELPGGD